MTDKKDEKQGRAEGCGSCGDDRVMLTEERNAVPRCAGCGKSLDQSKEK